MAEIVENEGLNTIVRTRLRIAATTENNFLACIREGIWGARNAIFNEWESADLLALEVDQHIAGVAEVTGPAFISQESVWKDKIYPHRIPVRFLWAMRRGNRLPISQIKDVLESAWEGIYGKTKWGLGIRSQRLLPADSAKLVIDAIHSCNNDLDDIKVMAARKEVEQPASRDVMTDFRAGPKEPQSWIFQSNPKIYDIDAALDELKELRWLVNQHADNIREGDKVFLWRAGPKAGIVAIAGVLTAPTIMEDSPEEQRFYLEEGKFLGPHLRVGLSITRRVQPTLSRERIAKEPRLANLAIIKAPQGTNFPATNDEAAAILELISTGAPEPSPETYSIKDAASGIFLEESALQEMLTVWRAKKNLILQGPPGVGKTFIGKRLAYALIGFKDHRRLKLIQFHQSLSYEDFMQGYRPYDKGFVRKDGPFFEFCTRASTDVRNIYVFFIDEINRGNLSKIFGEALMLIEPDKRSHDYAVNLAYSTNEDPSFFVPPNVYLLGTMNTADRSLAFVDYALRRRFNFVTVQPEIGSAAFRAFLLDRKAPIQLVDLVIERMTALNQEISEDKTNLGPGFAIGLASSVRRINLSSSTSTGTGE